MSAITTPPLDSTNVATPTNVAQALEELQTIRPRPHPWLALLGFGAASLAAGALGAMATRRRKNKLWYRLFASLINAGVIRRNRWWTNG